MKWCDQMPWSLFSDCWILDQLFLFLFFWVVQLAAAAAKSLRSCPTLCDPRDGSPPGSPIPGILQARTLEWGAISLSNAWKGKGKVKSLSRVWLLATPWTAAHRLPWPWDSPGKNTGVGCRCLLHCLVYPIFIINDNKTRSSVRLYRMSKLEKYIYLALGTGEPPTNTYTFE